MANKLMKETPVHMSCPHCGKLQHPRLKWAKNHKSLKCRHCGKTMDLREKHTQSLIGRTLKALMSFEKLLDALRTEAKQDSKAVKAAHADDKRAKKTATKKAKNKAPAKRKKKSATRGVPSTSATSPVAPDVSVEPAGTDARRR